MSESMVTAAPRNAEPATLRTRRTCRSERFERQRCRSRYGRGAKLQYHTFVAIHRQLCAAVIALASCDTRGTAMRAPVATLLLTAIVILTTAAALRF